ncbi:hypothetical protein [Limnoglobus roseus]|uniref:Uncharacterized protein n=1 Tax=Limnoglobus roseus TaxID=2598579 RepID=A0A5C1ASL7_9BACT|nr:hypothetical protein [Limnoglobus roseus]QEL19898.1 hypothetical protein PX52LOC_06980 [Limnoglobus roseus]
MSTMNEVSESAVARVLREIREAGPLTLHDVGAMLKDTTRPKGVSYPVCMRWVVSGAKVLGGGTVKLDAVRAGHRWLTSQAALERFLLARNGETPQPPAVRSVSQRKRAAAEAGKELTALGV